jgi:hypothetical protein
MEKKLEKLMQDDNRNTYAHIKLFDAADHGGIWRTNALSSLHELLRNWLCGPAVYFVLANGDLQQRE